MMAAETRHPIELEALALFRELLRIDTTNPHGGERPAAELLAEFFRREGLEPTVIESQPTRASLVVRLRGNGKMGGPLLLASHLDVVPADAARWRHPPFAGEVHDGWVWGRGAIDMKHMVAMSAMVLALLKRRGRVLGRDLIFAAVADEEAGCSLGSRFLVEHHPDLVRAEFALGELGGFPVYQPRKTFYVVQTGEKGICWLRARVRGTPGHGSIPRDDNAVVRLGEALARIGRTRLPAHPVQQVVDLVHRLADAQPFVSGFALRQVLNPWLAPLVLRAMPDRSAARTLDAQLRNTATPTMLRAGSKTNVIPAVAESEIDGRLLPGQTPEQFLSELRRVVGEDVEFEIVKQFPSTLTDPVESPVWSAIGEALAAVEPEAEPLPYLIPGFTDASAWSRLGTRCYGFCPVRFGPEVRFADLYHADNERIPLDGFFFGLHLLYDVVRRVTERL